jgi:hypothetical protein
LKQSALVLIAILFLISGQVGAASEPKDDPRSHGSGGVELRLAGSSHHLVSDGVGRNAAGDPVVWGGMLMCVPGHGTATIVGVEPVSPTGGLHVQGFAVRPNPIPTGGVLVGDFRGTLSDAGFGSDTSVTVSCDSHQVGVELAVQAARPGSQDASSSSWRVSYSAGGRTGSLVIPLAVQLCGERSPSAPECSGLSPLP